MASDPLDLLRSALPQGYTVDDYLDRGGKAQSFGEHLTGRRWPSKSLDWITTHAGCIVR